MPPSSISVHLTLSVLLHQLCDSWSNFPMWEQFLSLSLIPKLDTRFISLYRKLESSKYDTGQDCFQSISSTLRQYRQHSRPTCHLSWQLFHWKITQTLPHVEELSIIYPNKFKGIKPINYIKFQRNSWALQNVSINTSKVWSLMFVVSFR